ncbi:MAG: IPT/TIG domain-containing protein [Niastella sp.]|nr:IPT/TIG domain-containing protein [Niastella sp.]
MNRKPLLIFLISLSLFAACKKDEAGPPPPPPTTEPLAIAAAKPGDTLFIKGENFSEVIANNTVKINGVTATVVVASNTELKVLIPANATSGEITVTVNNQTIEVGSIIIAPFRLYAVKNNYQNVDAIRQVISIDPANGSETVITTLDDPQDYKMEDMVYVPATNELIGVNMGRGLLKIDVATKQKTRISLTVDPNIDFGQLVVDKYGNFYAVKRDFTDLSHYKHALVKIDPKTGTYMAIKTFEYNPYWESLVYLAATNEVVGLGNTSQALFKLNLTTKDTVSVKLQGAPDIEYRELVIDNQSNLYSYKGNYSDPNNYIGQIVKLNPATGQETLVSTLTEYGKLHDNLIFVPQRNELTGIWDQTGLYRLNLGTKTSSILPLTTQQSITYNEITSN